MRQAHLKALFPVSACGAVAVTAWLLPSWGDILAVAVAAFAVVGGAITIAQNGAVSRTHFALWPAFAVGGAAAAIALQALLRKPGMPLFNQDWGAYPLFREQMHSWIAYGLRAWIPDGLGHANQFPFIYPLQTLAGLLGIITGSQLSLRILFFVAIVLATVTSAHFLRACGYGRAPSLLGAAFYAVSPVLLNKSAAGHFAYLFGYAILPFVAAQLYESCSDPRVWRTCALAVSMAFAASQSQFFGFALAFAAVFCLFVARTAKSRIAIAVAMLSTAVLQSPALYPLLSGYGTRYLMSERVNLQWEKYASVVPHDTLALMGYLIGYDARTYTGIAGAMVRICIIAALLAGVFALRRRSPLIAASALAAGAALLVEMGLRGPLATLFTYLFTNVTASTYARELYNCAGIVALFCAIGIAEVQAVLRSTYSIAGLTLFVFICALQFSSFTHYTTVYQPSAGLTEIVHRIAQTPGDGRVLWLPAVAPIGSSGSNGGLDPMTVPIGAHASLQTQLPQPAVALVMARTLGGKIDASTLASLGVQFVVIRKDLHTLAEAQLERDLRRHVKRVAPHAASFEVAGGHTVLHSRDADLIEMRPSPRLFIARRSVWMAEWSTASAFESIARKGALFMDDPPVSISSQHTSVDPTKGPTNSAYWYWLDPLVDDVPKFGPLAIDAALCTRSPARVFVRGLWARRPKGCWSNVGIVAVDPGVPQAQFRGQVPLSDGGAVSYRGGWMSGAYRGTYQAASSALLILNETFDPLWRINVDGTLGKAPVRVNAYQTGFPVPSGSHTFRITYAATPVVRRLLGLATMLWVAGILGWLGGALVVRRENSRERHGIHPSLLGADD